MGDCNGAVQRDVGAGDDGSDGGGFGPGGVVEVRYVEGPPGPRGPAGPQGERGATGAKGAVGATGQTIVVEKEVPVVIEKETAKEVVVEKPVVVEKVAASRPAPTPVAWVSAGQPGTTTFQDTARQPLTATREDAVSTFSLDTDRTSFQLALNWARAGYRVDPASVRAEEWVNAFDYGYAAPRASDRFAITSDLFVHPLDNGKYMTRFC